MAIFGSQVCKVRTKDVALVKVFWRKKIKEEMTWEVAEYMRSRYPHLLHTMRDNNGTVTIRCDSTFKDECSEGGDDVTSHL